MGRTSSLGLLPFFALIGCSRVVDPAASTPPASSVTAALSASAPAAVAPPPPATYRGHAVFFVDAIQPCPKVGVGSRSAQACMRLGLDDEHTTMDIDRARHRIVVRNDKSYADEQIIGDVVLPGWSDGDGGHTPVAVHAVFRKNGNDVKTKIYSHVVVRDKPKTVTIEDFEIVLADGTTETSLMSKKDAENALLDPHLSLRAAGFLQEVKDNLAGPSDAGAAKPIGDITLAAGIGPAAKDMVRAQLFKSGDDIELKFTALSSLVPKYVAQRDTFLYGIEAAPSVADVKARGLDKGETIDIAFKGGKGTVSVGGKTSELPDAQNSVRDFLQTAAVGMLLAHQAKLDGG